MRGGGKRRAYGSGSLYPHHGSWYAKWYVGSRQIKRKIGTQRKRGSRDGMTKAQAEKEMRRLMRELKPTPQERLTLREVGDAYIAHVRDFLERKPSTVQDYEGILNKAEQGLPKKTADRYQAADIEGYVSTMRAVGRSPKTISNHLIFLHGLFAFAVKRGWAPSNVVAEAERPRPSGTDPDIHYLDLEELEALLQAVPDDVLGAVDRPLYLTAAMTGLRQGELIALRWKDVDWRAGLIRVRRNYTRGRFGTPKSKRSSRAVQMPERVASELKQHFGRSDYTGDDDLVFCHPETGNPYDASRVRKRFDAAIRAAGIRPIRFHDLRHTFGTRMAAAGAPLRNIQEWMGHRDYRTTEIYADYAPDPTQEAKWVDAAFSGDESGEETSDKGTAEENPET